MQATTLVFTDARRRKSNFRVEMVGLRLRRHGRSRYGVLLWSARTDVEIQGASHVVYVSRPEEVAALIE